MKIKSFLIASSIALASVSGLSHAGFFSSGTSLGTSEGPTNWGPWYLYKSAPSGYWIECTYKRTEIKDTSKSRGLSSIKMETKILNVARYPFGACADTLN